MGIKELFLQKGWAGRTIDRAQTIERINPMIRTMNELMQMYAAAEPANASLKVGLEESLRTLRMDIGKMCEIVFSCGGVAYNGTDLNPADYRLGADLSGAIEQKEQELTESLNEEEKIEHQMRSRAILQNVDANQKMRLNTVRGL